MSFDFDEFRKIATRIYEQEYAESCPYSLEEVLHVFELFFWMYEQHQGETHPKINGRQIRKYIDTMPYITEAGGGPETTVEVDCGCYLGIMTRYFSTKYARCDYRIGHFFSGSIRWYKREEACKFGCPWCQ